ncbi:phosphotransferase [Streptomyces sp. 8L]|uniref:phosphotransferase n=1 Tax=Streptomyces sp. 8L TaxID=2877242 RepID=UPI001CD4AEA9|nr:phosphotransferase [Streptomyces sp. 8L]MCA1219175.1 glycosyltransferase [Streptomyces sp. 8L]
MSEPRRRLRVAVLFDSAGFQRSLPLTGAATRTLHLNQHLAEAGPEVTLLLCDLNPRSRPTLDWPFPVRYLPYEAVYEGTGRLIEHVKDLAPDVLVMSNTQLTVRYGRVLADAADAALVYEMHDDEAAVARTIGSGEWECRQAAVLQAAAVAASDAVVAFTSRDAHLATALRAAAVHVVPCGVEPGPAPLHKRESPGSAAFVGNLHYEPNARAATYLRTRLAPALAVRGGIVDVYGRYPRALRPLGTGATIRLHGPVPDLPSALSTASVGLAPLDSGGGMKLKVLQYMAAGLPVVGTAEAFAGLPDPGAFALVSTAPSMEDIPTLVTRLQDDATLRRELGTAGRRLIETEFSWAAAAQLALHAYQSVRGAAGPAAAPSAGSGGIRELAGRTPYWLHEWRTREETTMGETPEPATGNEHPVLARLASEIDCARHAAESALDTVFDQAAIVGYGGRSMVFLAKTAVLKIYTHRPAERARREILGLQLAGQVPDLRVPEVHGHDDVEGALSWVAATRLEGTAPGDIHDQEETRTLGEVAARLRALPADALTELPKFGRNIRPLDEDSHPVRARLSAVLTSTAATQQAACVTGFVHGDYSARNLLIAPGLPPGVIDFEGCGVGCVYEDLTNLYVQNCLIDGREAAVAIAAYEAENARLGPPSSVDTRHLLWHTARYFRWVLQWAVEIDTELADQITALAPSVLDALESEGSPTL